MASKTETRWDTDATAGNVRIARAAFIMEEMRQTGCLAIEAAHRFDRGERCEGGCTFWDCARDAGHSGPCYPE